jgi:hypothetical protein
MAAMPEGVAAILHCRITQPAPRTAGTPASSTGYPFWVSAERSPDRSHSRSIAMTKFSVFLVFSLMTALAGSVSAAPPQHGGGGHGGGAPHIGGGAPHIGGGMHAGGGMHVGGGGMHVGGGGMHIGAGRMASPHFSGGGRPHFGGGARFSAGHPAIRSAGRANFQAQRSFAGRNHGNFTSRGHSHLADHGRSNFNGSRRATMNRNTVSAGHNRNATSAPNSRNANSHANARSRAVRNALNSHSVAGALRNHAALRNYNARAQIAASAATAGWHDRHGRDGWWRHRHGGYGWVGPLFWPFAYYDMYDYAMWGYGDDPGFWDYGYNDIYAGLFAPYGYDDLAGYLPESSGANTNGSQSGSAPSNNAPSGAATSEQLAQMCGEDNRDIAGLPIDQIQQAIQPDDAQRAALDDLANASVKAAQDIRAACPTKVALTAPDRLASMQQRIEAMISAVQTVQPPLQKFYELLSDEQKARLNALGQQQSNKSADNSSDKNNSPASNCDTAQPGVTAWPTSVIESRVHPTEAQRASLASLQDASAKAADLLKSSCQTSQAITPPARLEVVGKRLDTMLQAVKMVRTALDDFYGKLSDEQKAQFETIGPERSASASEDEPAAPRSHVRHRHHVSVEGMIRRFISLAR